MLLKEDTGATGGDVEAGAVRDNEEDEVPFKQFAICAGEEIMSHSSS